MPASLVCPLLILALAWAVLSDLLYRRISNRLVLALLALWLVNLGLAALRGTPGWHDGLGLGLLAALLVLVAGYGLFIMRWMGAGDVKLMVVLCLWMGDDAFTFLMATSLAGGVLALGMPMLRWVERWLALGVLQLSLWWPGLGLAEPVSLRGGAPGRGGLPYGLAIAAGAASVLWVRH